MGAGPPPNDNLCRDPIVMPRSDCTDRSSSLSVSKEAETLVLFPDLQLKRGCGGTAVSLALVGRRNMNGNGTIKLQFWRKTKSGDYSRVDPEIILSRILLDQEWCETVPANSPDDTVLGNHSEQPTVHNCSLDLPLDMRISVQPGDVLGVVLPRNKTKSEIDLCLTEVRPLEECTCLFDSIMSQNNAITLNMPRPHSRRRRDDTECNCRMGRKLPQIQLHVEVDPPGTLMIIIVRLTL